MTQQHQLPGVKVERRCVRCDERYTSEDGNAKLCPYCLVIDAAMNLMFAVGSTESLAMKLRQHVLSEERATEQHLQFCDRALSILRKLSREINDEFTLSVI